MSTTSPGLAPPRVVPPKLGANLPPTPVPPHIQQTPGVGSQGQRLPTASFDMGSLSARETMIRRVVWIVVLLVAAGIGFLLASQL